MEGANLRSTANPHGMNTSSPWGENDTYRSITFYVQSIQVLEHGYKLPGTFGQGPAVAQDLGLNNVFVYLQQREETQ